MTIYLDVVLGENLIINFIILLVTCIIGKKKINLIRILLSSFIGSICSICSYILKGDGLLNILIKIIISICMIKVAFNICSLKGIVKILLIFYLVSLLFGGGAFMFLFSVDSTKIILRNNYFCGSYPIIVSIISSILIFFLVIITSFFYRRIISQICEVEIFYDGKNVKVKSFIDSGNLLKEPISNLDVIVVEKDSLIGILDNSYLNNFSGVLDGSFISDGNDLLKNKIKIIPYSSLGNQNGLLLGFKPDYIKIFSDEIITTENVIIGIYEGKLTKTNLYTSLIGLNVLKECESNDKIITNA